MIFLNISFPKSVNAEDTITNSAKVQYSIISEKDVTLTIDLKLYSSQDNTAIKFYTLYLPYETIDIQKIEYKGKSLKFTNTVEDKSTKIVIDLENSIAKKSIPLEIQITSKIKDKIVFLSGNDKLISLKNNFSNMEVSSIFLRYPYSWGKYEWASNVFEKESGDKQIYMLETTQTGKLIALGWGETINYNFELKRTISNPASEPTKYFDLIIPKSSSNQKITIQSISPTPFSANKDNDNNILLVYEVKAGEEINIQIQGQISKLTKHQKEEESALQLSLLTQQPEYWSFQDQYEKLRIQKYLETNGITEENILEMTATDKQRIYKLLYRYTLDRLEFGSTKSSSLESGLRMGANKVLEHRTTASPEDYVDFLSAIYRMYGIPTRMVEGYISNQISPFSENFYHSWIEYWDLEYGWKAVDPALEDYTGKDYFSSPLIDHISIMSRSYDPIRPTMIYIDPANFTISLAENKTDENIGVAQSVTIHPIYNIDNQAEGSIVMQNTGNSIITEIQIEGDNEFTIAPYNSFKILLPGQTSTIPFLISSPKENKDVSLKYTSSNGSTITNVVAIKQEKNAFWWWDLLVKTITISLIWIFLFLLYKIYLWIKPH